MYVLSEKYKEFVQIYTILGKCKPQTPPLTLLGDEQFVFKCMNEIILNKKLQIAMRLCWNNLFSQCTVGLSYSIPPMFHISSCADDFKTHCCKPQVNTAICIFNSGFVNEYAFNNFAIVNMLSCKSV